MMNRWITAVLSALDSLSTFVVTLLLLDVLLLGHCSYSLLQIRPTPGLLRAVCILAGSVWLLKVLFLVVHPHWRRTCSGNCLFGWAVAIGFLFFWPLKCSFLLNSIRRWHRVLLGASCWLIILSLAVSFAFTPATLRQGLRVYYYRNQEWNGHPFYKSIDRNFDLDTIQDRFHRLPWPDYSIAWQGWLELPETGKHQIVIESNGQIELTVDGQIFFGNPGKDRNETFDLSLVKGFHPITIGLNHLRKRPWISLQLRHPDGVLRDLPAENMFTGKPTPMEAALSTNSAMLGVNLGLAVIFGLVCTLSICLMTRSLQSVALIRRWHAWIGQESVAIGILLAIGVISRLIMMMTTSSVLWPDSFVYWQQSLALFKGWDWAHIGRGPMYPLFLALFWRLGITPATGLMIIAAQRIMGILSVVFFYKVGRKVFGPTVAFYGCFLLALHSLQLYYETVVQTETMFVFFLSLLLWVLLVAIEKDSWRWYALAGLLCGVMTLTRPMGQLYIGCVLLCVFIAGRQRPARAILHCAVILVLSMALIFPWMLHKHRTEGTWKISLEAGRNLFYRVYDLDKIPPVNDTRYPEVRDIFDRERSEFTATFYAVQGALRDRLGYSPVESDRAMIGFAFEGLRAHPWMYATAWLDAIVGICVAPHNSVFVCPSRFGPHLWSERTIGESLPPFPAHSPEGFLWAREHVTPYFEKGSVRMGAVMVFCAAGWILFFSGRANSRARGFLLILTILYFIAMATAFNAEEDRYRLPVDALLFLFAFYGLAQLSRLPFLGRMQSNGE